MMVIRGVITNYYGKRWHLKRIVNMKQVRYTHVVCVFIVSHLLLYLHYNTFVSL